MKKGFTLLELLIVVVILGVLALIATPTLLNAADQAKNSAVKANVGAAASSITSRFAIESQEASSQIISEVVGSLSTQDTNPVNTANASFDTQGTAPGSVVLTTDANNDVIIKGYDKNSSVLVTKTIQPLNN